MKKLLLVSFLFNFHFIILKGQSMLTNRDVYDYNIGDEFQWSISTNKNLPPGAKRTKILNKHFSSKNDTIFYISSFDNYSSKVNWSNHLPHMDYTFSSGIDTSFVTNLDSFVNSRSAGIPTDSCNSSKDTSFYSSEYCGIRVFEHKECLACCFEGENFTWVYGKGLGEVRYQDYKASEFSNYENILFYFKKGSIVCGTPDMNSPSSVIENGDIKENTLLYPNPSKNILIIEHISHKTTIRIYDNLGKIVLEKEIENNTTIDTSQLTQGIYTFFSEDLNGRAFNKIVISN